MTLKGILDTGSISGDQYDWSETARGPAWPQPEPPSPRAGCSNKPGITAAWKECKLERWMSQLFLLYRATLLEAEGISWWRRAG